MKKCRMGLPTCPHCQRTVPYRRLLAKWPIFSVNCPCGKVLRFCFGRRCLALWGVTLLLCVLLNRWMMHLVTETLPLFCFSLLLICTAFFLTPLLWHNRS